MTQSDETTQGINILVCAKFIVDPNQLQADAATGKPDFKRAAYRINTFDENAIEAALQLAAAHGGKVVAMSLIKQPPPREVMLKALAMGISALYLINDEEGVAADALTITQVLSAATRTIAEREGVAAWDLLLCGEASVDDYNGQVGPRLGTALDLPVITYASKLTLDGNRLGADRAVDDQSETVEVDLPALVTVGMEINDPRMPTVLQIMGAGRKPSIELGLSELGDLDRAALAAAVPLRNVETFAPPSSRKQVIIEGDTSQEVVEELLRRLGADGEVAF